MKIYILHKNAFEVECIEYSTDEELEKIYEDYDDSPMIAGTLFLTEDEFKAIREWKEGDSE